MTFLSGLVGRLFIGTIGGVLVMCMMSVAGGDDAISLVPFLTLCIARLALIAWLAACLALQVAWEVSEQGRGGAVANCLITLKHLEEKGKQGSDLVKKQFRKGYHYAIIDVIDAIPRRCVATSIFAI